jgi:hypothetical protein
MGGTSGVGISLQITNGFQSRCIFRIAWAANFGIAATNNAFVWVACRLVI